MGTGCSLADCPALTAAIGEDMRDLATSVCTEDAKGRQREHGERRRIMLNGCDKNKIARQGFPLTSELRILNRVFFAGKAVETKAGMFTRRRPDE